MCSEHQHVLLHLIPLSRWPIWNYSFPFPADFSCRVSPQSLAAFASTGSLLGVWVWDNPDPHTQPPLPCPPPLQYHSSQLKLVWFALAVTWMLHMLQCNKRTISAIRLLVRCWFFIKMCLTFFPQHYCYNIFSVHWFYKSALHYTEKEVRLVLNPCIKHSLWTKALRALVCYPRRSFNKSASQVLILSSINTWDCNFLFST